jgi:hypothetical protein
VPSFEFAGLQEYDTGVTAKGPFAFTAGVSTLKLELSREGWPDLGTGVDVVSIQSWVSVDGGNEWLGSGGFTAAGGVSLINRGGDEVTGEYSAITWNLPPQDAVPRQMKLEIEVFGEPITFKGTASW